MIHYLRTSNNRTIIECEVTKEDLSCSVNILEYSRMLLNLNEANKGYAKSFLNDIDSLSDIRGLWWEREQDFGDWKSTDEFVKSQFNEVAKRWGLSYITD
jgi:hypothetical protein